MYLHVYVLCNQGGYELIGQWSFVISVFFQVVLFLLRIAHNVHRLCHKENGE